MPQIPRLYKNKIAEQLDDSKSFYGEDTWLQFELKYKHRLKKSAFEEAIGFSMETAPTRAYQWNNYALPFGCHAFSANLYKCFWKPFANISIFRV